MPRGEDHRDQAQTQAQATAARRGPGRPRLTEPSVHHRERLDAIVSTAAQVFHRDGYENGSLDAVADELGLSKAGLYHYIKSKSELLYLVFDRAITTALDKLDSMSHLDDPRARLGELIRYQVLIVADESSMFSVFFDNRPRLENTYESRVRAKERRYLRIFAEAIEDAGRAGVIPKVDGRLGAQALIGMTSWTYKWFDPLRDSPEQVADTFVDLVLRPHQRE